MQKPRNTNPPHPNPLPGKGEGANHRCLKSFPHSRGKVPDRADEGGGRLLRTFGTVALSLLAAFLLHAPSAHATVVGSAPPPVQYIVSPEAPNAGETVYIQVNGVGNFLGESPITWTQNGKVVSQGIGKRDFSFTVGGFGSQTVIGVTINSAHNGIIRNQWTFNPSLVNLVWEAHTTVPPFYDGKALASPGSSVTVTAFPVVVAGGVRQSPANLVYQWKLNGDPQPSRSGIGFRSFTFTTSQIHSQEEVSVDVLLSDANTKVAYSDISVPLVEPELVLYEHDPLRGVLYDRALGGSGSFTMSGTEMTVRAEPYFFSAESVMGRALKYAWQINGNDTTGPNTAAGELTLRQTGTGPGTADLSVSLQNQDTSKILQGAQYNAQVLYGGTSQGKTLFGL